MFGLASGLLYWAAAEPIIHLQANPFLVRDGIDAGTQAAVQTAVSRKLWPVWKADDHQQYRVLSFRTEDFTHGA